jgi:hypothetical protein
MSLARGEIELNSAVEYMRFTLTYEGPLHAEKDKDTRVREKHDIRRKLHPQILDVWLTHPELGEETFRTQTLIRSGQSARDIGLELPKATIRDFLFVPLVNDALWAVCELDILFLRREPPGSIVNFGGDLDNRLKVLFDALRMPEHESELPPNVTAAQSERPFACLLQSDKLITGFRVDTQTLLGPIMGLPDDTPNVKLVIGVNFKVRKLTYWNFGMGTDL